MLAQDGFKGVDETDPTAARGHAYGLHKSRMLTTDYRTRLKRGSVDVTPHEVIDCLRAAGVKDWVLMGLHGYVGYLPMPRATQDVDVMVPYSQKQKAKKAIATQWPMLTIVELSQVIRFLDPEDLDHDGKPQPVIDIMLPWSPFQETILKECVIEDEETGSRYPNIEAAIVSKYAPLVSPYRTIEKKEQDSSDLRKIVKGSPAEDLDHDLIHRLADQVWEGGGDELLHFIQLALDGKPFPI
ncbi:hypothetical protein [Rubripirellula obstinata]|nr:hypothetical protein [Rubripirellula obstinata]